MNAEAENRFELEVATLTDVGTEREHNEDHCGQLLERSGLRPGRRRRRRLQRRGGRDRQSDGRGGHAEGLRRAAPGDGDPQAPLSGRPASQHRGLRSGDRRPGATGMTTTLTAVVVDRGELTAAHIGDSRLYLLRDGQLTQLSKDHTVAGEKARIGLMSKSRARQHPDRSVLTRSLGRELIVPIDRISNRLYRGDALLVCSDGLYNVLDEEQMAPLITQRGRRRRLPQADRHRQWPRDPRQRERRCAPGAERPRAAGGVGQPGRPAAGPLHPTRRLKLRPASRKDPAARSIGEVAEWPKAPDSKSGLGASPTWVRLPPSPR